jgi:mono/diheme cytochrome c family protein
VFIMRFRVFHALVVLSLGSLIACNGGEQVEGPIVPPPPAPAEYAEKHMPVSWWGDAQKLEEGRKLFLGETNPDVNCASCHGKDGKPVKAGATDFRNPERMKLYSDAVWFWRISEGVPTTKMKGWKSKLSEDDRWKLVLFERSFGLPGKFWSMEKNQWDGRGFADAVSAVLL